MLGFHKNNKIIIKPKCPLSNALSLLFKRNQLTNCIEQTYKYISSLKDQFIYNANIIINLNTRLTIKI